MRMLRIHRSEHCRSISTPQKTGRRPQRFALDRNEPRILTGLGKRLGNALWERESLEVSEKFNYTFVRQNLLVPLFHVLC